MFLLQTIKNYKLRKKKDLFNVFYYEILINKIEKQVLDLIKIKEEGFNDESKQVFINNNLKDNYKSEGLVTLILGVSVYKTNIIVYLTDVKGKVRYYNTSGILGITKKQKRKTISVILKLLKVLVAENNYLNKDIEIALHFKNLNKRTCFVITTFLTKNLTNMKVIKISNNQPHNGCRPKKIKRKKRRKILFTKS